MTAPDRCKVGFLWNPLLETFDFGTKHPIRIGRFLMVKDFLAENDFLDQPNVEIITPEYLPDELLKKIHSQKYLDEVREISETGLGEIDIDTPGYKGIYENASITSGATVTGIQAVVSGKVDHFFSPTGGFHHAMFDQGGGFCIFNDVAAAIYELKSHGFKRILVADFDVHHGNGTQTYFYDDPEVMQISFHEDPEWMYPHDGFIHDIGEGSGRGYNINMPFPMDSCDGVYRYAFDNIVPPLVEFYKPEFIIFLPGFDAHYKDRMAHLNLTTDTIRYIASYIHKAAHKFSSNRLGVMASGGYTNDSLKWGIGVVMSVLSGYGYEAPTQEPPYEDNEETWDEVRKNVEPVKERVFPIHGISF
ncbi:MAG: histone deacetylase family protein [Candidatus Thorarchaeota archaeon]|jgi:acetoin utilization protein AcuC